MKNISNKNDKHKHFSRSRELILCIIISCSVLRGTLLIVYVVITE